MNSELTDELQKTLQEGCDAIDRGDVAEWDPERIKAEGRKRLAETALTPDLLI